MARSDPVESLDAQWLGGVDSFSDPRLGQGFVQRAWNVMFRAGVVRTRPGTGFIENLPEGTLQGFTHFEPRRGPAQLIAIIDGNLYVARYPFTTWVNRGRVVHPLVKKVYFCRVEQSLRRNSDDSLTLLPAPRALLVIQDGVSPPAVWNGSQFELQTGVDKIPQGTVMVWSGYRLWVARDNWVFASDFANPYSFVERYYLGGADSLLAPGRVTAMAEIEGTSEPQLLIFTENKTLVVQSNILSRELWTTTPNFSRILFPNVGCTSHRSVVSHFGQLWWWTAQGLTSFDLAASVNVTSLFPLVDNPMSSSKAFVTPTDGTVACTAFENALLVSVPYGGKYNRHTWVLDEAVLSLNREKAPAAWAGTWTGFQPVEWTRFLIDGSERVYAAVTDGTRNQIIELSHRYETDSGKDIECAVELKVESHGAPTIQKIARFAELTFSEVAGDVDVRADWRGLYRGRYKQCLSGRFRASRGSISASVPISGISSSAIYATRGQARRVRTSEISNADRDALSNCVEDFHTEERDRGFNLLVRWNGRAALREVREFISPEQQSNAGECVVPETDALFVRFDGGSSATGSFDDTSASGSVFTGTGSASYTVGSTIAAATRVASSVVSQSAADKNATQYAQAQAALTLAESVEPTYGSTNV